MRATYAVVWHEGDQPITSGRLEIRERSVAFSGGNGVAIEREVPLDSLRAVHVGRSPEDRLDGRASLVLEPRDGPVIRIAGVAQPGIVAELAERIAALETVPDVEELLDLSFEPTPGPGDSEGGDLYAP